MTVCALCSLAFTQKVRNSLHPFDDYELFETRWAYPAQLLMLDSWSEDLDISRVPPGVMFRIFSTTGSTPESVGERIWWWERSEIL